MKINNCFESQRKIKKKTIEILENSLKIQKKLPNTSFTQGSS